MDNQGLWHLVPGKPSLHFYDGTNYKAIIREVNGHDLFWLAERDFNLKNAAEVTDLVLRLQVSTRDDLFELELPEFNRTLKDICNKLVEKNIINIESWFEVIFIVGGKRFDPDYTPWLDTSISTLLGMSKIAQKYLATL